MTKRKIFLSVVMAALTQGVWAQLGADTFYVSKDALPDASYYLPAPPDTASMDYIDDLLQWQWGKTQRPLPRGRQASDESLWLPRMIESIMAHVLELDTISPEATPAIDRLLVRAYHTGNYSTKKAKDRYMRIRPFMQMGEDTWAQWDDDYLRTNGSYPSGHTGIGWATALAFAEMWPELQDTILRRGFQFGENRIITGAHYQSDVNAGYMCGSASIAAAHNNPWFEEDIAAARAEYKRLKGLPADYEPTTNAGLPHGSRFLNTVVDTTSHRYPGELARYWTAKAFRKTPRGEQAVRNIDSSAEYMMKLFGDVIGKTISPETTPALAQLISDVRTVTTLSASELKTSHFRKRPFVQLGEPTAVPVAEDGERGESSYASCHAQIGWAIALVLAEVVPEKQNEILRVGYDYGYDRVITGYHWATDIEAARLLASAVVARLHADKSFLELVAKAKKVTE